MLTADRHGTLYIKKDANVTWNVDKIMDFDSTILNKSSIKVPVVKRYRIVHNSSLFKSKDYGSTDPSRRFEDMKNNHTRPGDGWKSLESNVTGTTEQNIESKYVILERLLNESKKLKAEIKLAIKCNRDILGVLQHRRETTTTSNETAYVTQADTSNEMSNYTHLNSTNNHTSSVGVT